MGNLRTIFAAAALSSVALLTSAAVPTATTIADIDGAIRADNLTKLRQLVRSRADAKMANGVGQTPLHYAAMYGSPEALAYLLKMGAGPNARNLSGATPLVLAAGSYERTRLLVEHGATVNVATKEGVTPLIVAATAHDSSDSGNRRSIATSRSTGTGERLARVLNAAGRPPVDRIAG
jgi:ankyrin repeat protein